MDKQRWNLRIWKGDAEEGLQVLPWTPVVIDNMPNLSESYEDPDDDPRSFTVHLSWNRNLDIPTYESFNTWVVESLDPEAARKKTNKRKSPVQCMAEINRGQETRFLNYVYLEEITYLPLDYIDIGLVEVKAIIDYRSMTQVPIMVKGIKHLEEDRWVGKWALITAWRAMRNASRGSIAGSS
jgi:hypothetical protein